VCRSQSAQVASGTIGDLPNVAGQGIAATVIVSGQLNSIEQFGSAPLGFAVGEMLRGIRQRHHHVLQCAGATQQIEALKDEPDLLVTK
jgi:hypothetical protein